MEKIDMVSFMILILVWLLRAGLRRRSDFGCNLVPISKQSQNQSLAMTSYDKQDHVAGAK